MVPGAKHALQAITGRTIVSSGEKAELGTPEEEANLVRMNDSVEFAIILLAGLIFYTGGFEDIASLESFVNPAPRNHGEEVSIEGSFHPGNVPWVKVKINGSHIIGIIDLRTDQNGDEEER